MVCRWRPSFFMGCLVFSTTWSSFSRSFSFPEGVCSRVALSLYQVGLHASPLKTEFDQVKTEFSNGLRFQIHGSTSLKCFLGDVFSLLVHNKKTFSLLNFFYYSFETTWLIEMTWTFFSLSKLLIVKSS